MFQKLLFRLTGTMSSKNIVKTCEGIGKELAQAAKTETLTPEKVMESLVKRIGKKNAEKIIVTSDKDSFVKFATDNGVIDKTTAELYFDSSLSAVLPGPKSKKTLLSLRLSDMTPEEAVNTATHELEHVLNSRHGLRGKFEKLYVKLRGQKWMDKYLQKYANTINMSALYTQQKLLEKADMGLTAIGGHIQGKNIFEQMGLAPGDTQGLKKVVKEIIDVLKSPGDKKLTLKKLKAIRYVLKDEARAYRVGGKAERYYEQAMGIPAVEPNTKSEIFADLYDFTRTTMKKDIRKARIKYYKDAIKKFFHIEKKPVSGFRT